MRALRLGGGSLGTGLLARGSDLRSPFVGRAGAADATAGRGLPVCNKGEFGRLAAIKIGSEIERAFD